MTVRSHLVLFVSALLGCFSTSNHQARTSNIISSHGTDPISFSLTEDIEFINEWYISGPFPPQGSKRLEGIWASSGIVNQSQAADLSEPEGGPSWILRSIEPAVVQSADPETKEIRNLDAQIINFLGAFPKESVESSAYALIYLDSPVEETKTLLVGSDDGITIWLNGEMIHDWRGQRPIVPDEDIVLAPFREGRNVLLLHVRNDRGYWGFMLRFLPKNPASHLAFPAIDDLLD